MMMGMELGNRETAGRVVFKKEVIRKCLQSCCVRSRPSRPCVGGGLASNKAVGWRPLFSR